MIICFGARACFGGCYFAFLVCGHLLVFFFVFFFNDTATTEIYTLSLHDALPIFLAEVASTFNEELLTHHLLEQTSDPKMRAYIINRQIDDLRGTLFRQTM